MKNVLYIGNALSKRGKTLTSVEILSQFLAEFCEVKIASKKNNKVLRLLDMLWLIVKNGRQSDFVLIDTYSTVNFYYALIVATTCRFFGLNYIPILRGGNLEKRLKRHPWLSGLIFKSAYALVAPSTFMMSVFKNYGYHNCQLIPNSIRISNYPFIRRELESINLLWVRSFSKIYNPKLAVLILEELKDKGFGAHLTMVGPDGDGTLMEVKRLVKSLNLDVNFTGKLTKDEWINLSKGHNIFINTTNFDNTPVSVIEAMALGLPVVSTNVGGIPFLLENEEEGLLVDPNNVDEMVNAILKLKNDRALAIKIVTNARKKAEQFDWEVVKSKWQNLLT